MPERLETRLAELAREVEYPPTPELVAAVRARVTAQAPRRRRWVPRSRRALVLAVSLALLGATGAAAAIPGVRHAIGDLLGLRGATVQRVPTTPRTPAVAGRDLGPRVTLAAAARGAGFDLLLPRDRALGAPESVHLAGGARVTLVYPSATLTQARGSTALDVVRKLTPPSTPIRRVRVNGQPGLYVDGPHAVMFSDASGRVVVDRARSTGPALLWQQGPLLLRLEADVGQARALQIARSVR